MGANLEQFFSFDASKNCTAAYLFAIFNRWTPKWHALCSSVRSQFITGEYVNANTPLLWTPTRQAVIPALYTLITLSKNDVVIQKLSPRHGYVSEVRPRVAFISLWAHEDNLADISGVRQWLIIAT